MKYFIGISTTEKDHDNFAHACIWHSQSVTDTSLTSFSALNDWQPVLFLKHEWSQLLVVGKVVII